MKLAQGAGEVHTSSFFVCRENLWGKVRHLWVFESDVTGAQICRTNNLRTMSLTPYLPLSTPHPATSTLLRACTYIIYTAATSITA